MMKANNMSPMSLVLSYPRSGMNWLRHCVETMSGRLTPGPHLGLLDTDQYAFCRLHNIKRGQAKANPRGASWNRVCLILRDYRENYVRTPYFQRSKFTTIKKWNFTSYAENILYFNQYPGPKLLLRYESHVKGFDDSIQFLEWAEIPHQPLAASQLQAEVQRSKGQYRKDQNKYYRRIPNRQITPETAAAARQSLVKILGESMFAKYLGCYDRPLPASKAA